MPGIKSKLKMCIQKQIKKIEFNRLNGKPNIEQAKQAQALRNYQATGRK